jgi:outer membrane lipoprotein SlyB
MNAAKIAVAVLIAVSLSGCVTAEMAKSGAIKKGQAHCASEGKQFVVKDVTANQHINPIVSEADAEVVGECVGPGDPGYIPPAGS